MEMKKAELTGLKWDRQLASSLVGLMELKKAAPMELKKAG